MPDRSEALVYGRCFAEPAADVVVDVPVVWKDAAEVCKPVDFFDPLFSDGYGYVRASITYPHDLGLCTADSEADLRRFSC